MPAPACAVPTLREMRAIRRSVSLHLLLRGRPALEGSTSSRQMQHLAELTVSSGALMVAETGFNAGYSSHAFLASDPRATVVSFDLDEHRYASPAKALIDTLYPGRHTLVAGDSRRTVAELHEQRPDLRFDLVFIDGGHDYEVAASDIRSLGRMSTAETVVVMDDLVPWKRWGRGPCRAWQEAVSSGVIRQDGIWQDGRRVDAPRRPGSRAWGVGRFVG